MSAATLPADFDTYFGVADELDGGLTLADLDTGWITRARKAAGEYQLPWPPDLVAAEEFYLDWVNRPRFVGRSRATGGDGPRERRVRLAGGREVWVEEGSALWDEAAGV